MTTTAFFSIILACFSGGILSGLAGFGALIIIIPALALLVGMNITIPLGVLCGITIQGVNVYLYRAHVRKGALARMIAGALPGIWLGSSLLVHLPEPLLRFLLGALIIGYVAWSFQKRTLPAPTGEPGKLWTYVTGFFSGGFGAAFGINGPPVALYLTRTNWTPAAMRAFLGIFCCLLFIITAVMMFARGLITPEVWKLAALAAPCCLAGSLCGRRIALRMDARQYMRLVFLLLFCMGLSLCWPAVRMSISG
ncbi:MAG: sulfite exporter TauE/SafE family protein [Desulfovibrionaceae bacterium]|nr:sulfite exporter TauE/SafE family protein [Desulfovibrionaceae bacterium]